MSDVERYHRRITGTFAVHHSANQQVAKLYFQGTQTFEAEYQREQMQKLRRAYPPIDSKYLADKLKRVSDRVSRVLAGYDGGIPEVFEAELRFLGLASKDRS